MTVSSTNVRSGPYTPDGVVTTFPYGFVAFSAAEISVFSRLGGIDTPITVGWTATGLGAGSGNIVFAVAPSPAIGELHIESKPTFSQGLNLDNGGGFFGPSIEQAFDRAAVRDLYLKDVADRSVTAPVGEAGLELPSIAARKGLFLAFDSATGDPLAVDPGSTAAITVGKPIDLPVVPTGRAIFRFDNQTVGANCLLWVLFHGASDWVALQAVA